MFVASILFYVAAAVLGILFWVWAVRGIVAKIYKNTFGKKNVVRLILFGLFGWLCFFIGIGFSTVWLATGGVQTVTEKSAAFAAVTRESARKGWSKGLLKKMNSLDFSLDTVQEVEDELSLTSSSLKTYEATLMVKNPDGEQITYKELSRANIAYGEDENGVFIPGFIVNHSNSDEIPWLFRIFLPSYRKNQRTELIPQGTSYLNIRIDVAENHILKKIGLGEKTLEVDAEKILPLRVDDNFSKHDKKSESETKSDDEKSSEIKEITTVQDKLGTI